MAQLVLDANKYPPGTRLSSFDFATTYSANPAVDFEVTEIGATGRKYWRSLHNADNSHMARGTPITDYELLLLADFTRTEVSSGVHGFKVPMLAFENAPTATSVNALTAYVNGSNVQTWNTPAFHTFSTNTAPTSLQHTRAVGCRFQFVNSGATLRLRAWGADVGTLEANEPGVWNLVGARNTLAASAIGTPMIMTSSGTAHFSVISIGTGGDPAVYPDPEQNVATPTGLSVSNITDTTADVDWT